LSMYWKAQGLVFAGIAKAIHIAIKLVYVCYESSGKDRIPDMVYADAFEFMMMPVINSIILFASLVIHCIGVSIDIE